MNQQHDGSIFDLEVTPVIRIHMAETAKWGKFLAILGLVCMSLLLIAGGAAFIRSGKLDGVGSNLAESLGAATAYVAMALAYYYLAFALYKFCTLSKLAVETNNQPVFNEAFRYLRKFFKGTGIMAIVLLAFYLLGIAVEMLSGI